MVAGDYLTAAPYAAEVHFSLVRFRIGLHSLPKGGDIPLQGEEDVNTGIAQTDDGSTRRPKSQASGGGLRLRRYVCGKAFRSPLRRGV